MGKLLYSFPWVGFSKELGLSPLAPQRELNIAVLGRGLLLFEFELLSEVERVLARGKRRVKENVLFLEKWNVEGGAFVMEPSLMRLG